MPKLIKYLIIILIGYVTCSFLKNPSNENYKQNKNPMPNTNKNPEMNINEEQSYKIRKIVRNIWVIIFIILFIILEENYNKILLYLIHHQIQFWIPFKTTLYICFEFSIIFFLIFAIYENKIKSKIIQFIAWNFYFFCSTMSILFLIIFIPVTMVING